MLSICFLVFLLSASRRDDAEFPTEWPTSITEDVATIKGVTISVPSNSTRDRTPRSVIVSVFINVSNFYHGRAPPKVDWLVVLARSLYQHRHCDRCQTHNSSGESKLVLFLDLLSVPMVSKRMTVVEHNRRVSLTDIGFLEIVAVSNETHGDILAQRYAWGVANGANNYRFEIIRRWLHLHHSDIDRVGIVDATDVAFQANPFDGCSFLPLSTSMHYESEQIIRRKNVVFTLENNKKTFKNEVYNRRWMACYGEDVLSRMAKKNRRISCAGVTIGGTEGMQEYCRLQMQEIGKKQLLDCASFRVKAALDQATHNYILHNEGPLLGWRNLSLSTASEESDDCVWHGNFGTLRWRRNEVVSASGSPFAIVHQFTADRHPVIENYLRRRYIDEM